MVSVCPGINDSTRSDDEDEDEDLFELVSEHIEEAHSSAESKGEEEEDEAVEESPDQVEEDEPNERFSQCRAIVEDIRFIPLSLSLCFTFLLKPSFISFESY